MPLPERFWNRVDKNSDGGCWLWTGTIEKDGYARMKVDGRMKLVHRISLEEKLGRPLSDKMDTCHSCRNRHCVNPEHLREDTRKGNMADRLKDQTDNRGTRNRTNKLTEQDVLNIFNSVRTNAELAKQYDVKWCAIWCIKNGRTWTWLTNPS